MEPGALGFAAEFGDIRAGDEGPAFPVEHDRLHGVIGEGRGEPVKEALAHAAGERVHRGVIDTKDGQLAVHGIVHRTFHASLPCSQSTVPSAAAPLGPIGAGQARWKSSV